MDDLKKGFKLVYGMPIAQYMRSYRMRKAAEMLCRTKLRVQEIAARVGYDHPGKFALAFRERMHFSTAAYRKQMGCNFTLPLAKLQQPELGAGSVKEKASCS